MAKRSSRNKIRFHAEKAANDIDRALEQLLKIDIIANDRSDQINQTVPKLVFILEGFRKMLLQWRETL